jgi:RNA polymerase sigma-70 factor (ECF subfamily)
MFPTALLPSLRRGDTDAWRSLFETYAEPLYLYAYHRCGGDPAAAEDIRQETFIAAIQSIDRYRGDAPLFGWLCGIARHRAADQARRGQRKQVRVGTRQGAEEAGDLPENRPDPRQPLPELAVISGEESAAVVEALWTLSAEYRQALVWRYAQGRPVDEIARLLNRPYKAAESLLSRARAALRERLVCIDKEETDERR